jgi:hypothetical protein
LSWSRFPQLIQKSEAVHFRHQQIEQDHIQPLGPEPGECLAPVCQPRSPGNRHG